MTRSDYLEIVVLFWLVSIVRRIERIHDDHLRAANLGPAKRAAVSFGVLPERQACRADQVATRLDSHVFIAFGTDLAELKRRAHAAVKFWRREGRGQLSIEGPKGKRKQRGKSDSPYCSCETGIWSSTSGRALSGGFRSRPSG